MPEAPATRPYRGLTPQQRVEDRRRRLLAAGRECFAEAGDTTPWVGTVCTRAGVSKRHFYELYEDRLDLVRALHVEAIEWFVADFDDSGHPDDPLGWVRHLAPELFARLLEDLPRARVLALAPTQIHDDPRTVADLVVDGLARRVRRVPHRPAASPERVRRHALGAVHAGRALMQEWLLAPGGPRRGRAQVRYVEDVVSVTGAALAPVLP